MKKSELKEIIIAEYLAEAKDSKKGNEDEQKRMEGAIRDNRDHIKKLKADIEADEKKLAKLKKDYKKDVIKEEEDIEEMRGSSTYEEDDITAEGLLDFLKKKKEEAPKPKSGSSNEPIGVDYDGNYIYANEGMTEAEEVDVEDNVDVDVDVEDDIEIDDVSDKSEIEVDSELAGESGDTAAVLGLLTKAQEKASDMGDDKLMDQIGNTITYYTRAHVVAEESMEEMRGGATYEEDDIKAEEMRGGGVEPKDDGKKMKEELNEEFARFQKLAGLIK